MSDQTRRPPEGNRSSLPAQRRERRQRIIDAARQALERQEYDQIQIRDVAQAGGVALGTLYRYFSSKEHLYATVLLEWAAFGRPPAEGWERLSGEERIRARIHGIIAACERAPQFYKVHVTLESSADPNATALLTELANTAQALLADDVEVLRPGLGQDAATMLWSLLSSALTRAIYRDSSIDDVRHITDRFVDLIADPGLET